MRGKFSDSTMRNALANFLIRMLTHDQFAVANRVLVFTT